MSSSTRGRGLNKHFWTEVKDAALVDSLLELSQSPLWKIDCGFKNGYLQKLEAILEENGFGWDSEAMKLICDKSVFEDYVKKRPTASGLFNKPFPHYYTLGEIYGRDCVIGANAGNADDDEEEVRQEDNLNVNLGNDSTNEVSMNDFGDDISSVDKSAPSQAENAHSSLANKSKKRKKQR
ncbi:hypothetical protein WN944_026494 [Citrus x changshan-huyou]|uniref:Myb/SANT-like domain-containing protein n=1 Tax=Citrus x changshan-huyou TaxID=2935761 RepID=A0AAP0LUI2_9ROSI